MFISMETEMKTPQMPPALLVPVLLLGLPGAQALPYYFVDTFTDCAIGQHGWTVTGGNAGCAPSGSSFLVDPSPTVTASRDVAIPIAVKTYAAHAFTPSAGSSDFELNIHFQNAGVVTLRYTDAGTNGNNGLTFCTPLGGCEANFASWSSHFRPAIEIDPLAGTARALALPYGTSTAHPFPMGPDVLTKIEFRGSEAAPDGQTFEIDMVVVVN